MPFFIVGKEISLEDVRLSLDKLPDRFIEHPASVIVITNLYYAEAPWLRPRDVVQAAALNWREVALEGGSSSDFGEQLRALDPFLVDGWQVKASEKTGNPMYVRPSVLVIYRKDHSFLLDNVIPKPGQVGGNYDLVVASQPWRARMSAEFKVKKVLGPLVRASAPRAACWPCSRAATIRRSRWSTKSGPTRSRSRSIGTSSSRCCATSSGARRATSTSSPAPTRSRSSATRCTRCRARCSRASARRRCSRRGMRRATSRRSRTSVSRTRCAKATST